MIERGIRGGITQCCKRYAKANNPLVEGYDSAKENSFILYLDSNNLYGYSMSQSLPMSEFQWVADIDEIGNILDLKEDDNFGYIYEVDIEYPETLHETHKDLPFLAEKLLPPNSQHPKLLTTLKKKEKYVVHYLALKQAVEHGLIISKIHRVIKFKQSKWLAPYIQLNTDLRKRSKNAFEKDFYKLMNNAVFGKCMENVRNRLNMKLVVSEESLQRYVNKSTFLDRTIFAENVVAVHLAK